MWFDCGAKIVIFLSENRSDPSSNITASFQVHSSSAPYDCTKKQSTMTDPLPQGQQMFLQRLMAEHVMTDKRAEEVWKEIQGMMMQQQQQQQKAEDDDGDNSSMLEEMMALPDCLRSINQQLTTGFGLEIATMITRGEGDDGGSGSEKVHAVINQHADNVAKQSFPSVVDHNLRAYIRIVLETLVCGSGEEEGTKKSSATARSTLINMRSDLHDPLKLDMDSADQCLQMLLDEHWLTIAKNSSGKNGSSSSQRRRSSMKAGIQLGPRAFLELSHLLTDLGYPQDELPQFVFHR